MASYPIAEMRAIVPFYQAKLKAAGIRSTRKLLERAATPKLRKLLAEQTGIPMSLIVAWANIADLTRVRGIALDYAELLVAAGVHTVTELKRRNAANLATRMAAANQRKRLVQLLPTEVRIARWIAEAARLKTSLVY